MQSFGVVYQSVTGAQTKHFGELLVLLDLKFGMEVSSRYYVGV